MPLLSTVVFNKNRLNKTKILTDPNIKNIFHAIFYWGNDDIAIHEYTTKNKKDNNNDNFKILYTEIILKHAF